MRLFAVLAISLMCGGCSVYMAASSEGKKDLSVLRQGTDRTVVLAELGEPVATDWLVKQQPVATPPIGLTPQPSRAASTVQPSIYSAAAAPQPPGVETKRRYDIFSFVMERSAASNTGRAVAYGAAAVVTLGLSELLTTPLESGVGDAGERRFRIVYDQNDRVDYVEALNDDNKWVRVGETVVSKAEADKAADERHRQNNQDRLDAQ